LAVGLKEGSIVGDTVGEADGSKVVALVGTSDGASVGIAVGTSVYVQLVSEVGSITKPSRQSQVYTLELLVVADVASVQSTRSVMPQPALTSVLVTVTVDPDCTSE
jgi:hypothetical protein